MIIPEAWTIYFRNLYHGSSEDMEQFETKFQQNNDEKWISWDITLRDVKEAIKELKEQKGLNGITNEILKHERPNIQKEIAILFGKIINAGIIPQEWETFITLPLFKKR